MPKGDKAVEVFNRAGKVLAENGIQHTPEISRTISRVENPKTIGTILKASEKTGRVTPIQAQPEIKAAVIEGEKGLYEAPSHAEAIKEAQNAGEDIAMKDKQAEGKFTTTDGRVIDRKQAKEEFGVSQSHEVPKLKEEHDLMEQAKKYKTADEFAEKLGENYYRDIESDIVKPVKNSSGSKNLLKGSDNKPITMFHGTQTNFAGVFDPLKLGDATSAKSAKGAFFFT